MARSWLYAVLACALTAAPAQEIAFEEAGRRAEFLIVDASNQPLAGAEIHLVEPADFSSADGLRLIGECRSSAEGVCTLELEATIRPSAVMVVTHPQHGAIVTELSPQHWLGTFPARTTPIALPARARRAGQVVDAEGRPVTDAEVCPVFYLLSFQWFCPAPLLAVVTDSAGRFEVDGLPKGVPCGLRVHRPDVGAVFPGLPFGTSPSDPRQFSMGDAPLKVTLARGPVLEGRVVHRETGAAMPGVRLRMLPVHHTLVPKRETMTDDGGLYHVTGLPALPLWVVPVETDGLVGAGVRVDMAMGESVEAPPIRLGPPLRFVGHVVDAGTGEATGKWDVGFTLAYERQVAAASPITLAADGSFSVSAVPGLATLRAWCTDGDILPGDSKHRLVLAPGHVHTSVEIRIKDYDAFRGRVLLPDGQPTAGAVVKHIWRRYEAATDSDGVFHMALPAREYRAEHPMDSVFIATLGEGDALLRGAAVTPISTPEQTTLDIQLWKPAVLTGQVVDDSAAPIAGAQVACNVRMARVGFTDRTATTDAQGAFRLEGVLARVPMRVTAGGAESAPFELEPGEERRLPPIRYVPPRSMPGTPGL